MHARNAHWPMRIGLASFLVLASGVVTNLLLMQGPGGRGPAAARGANPGAAPAASPVVVTAPESKATKPAVDKRNSTAEPAAAATTTAEADHLASETPDSIRAIQRDLQARGYDAGTPDGVAGLVTRAAVMAWEHDHGLPLTGLASEGLARLIASGRAPQPRAARPGEKAPHAEHVVRTVQQSLAGLGYAPGAVTGRMSADTARAVREFEIDQGLPESGRVSGPLVARLGRLAGQGRLSGQARAAGGR